PLRRIAPFAVIAVTTMALIGWPIFKFGFDWVSYGNDDMSNYALWAHCFLEHGWSDPVAPEDLSEARDASRTAVFAYACVGERPGAELLLAWLAAACGKPTLASGMPLLLAMHGALVLALGALVYRGRSRRLAALAACILVGVSAPLTLGTLNQLMGQTGGLTLLCGSAAILLQPIRHLKWGLLLRRTMLLGVMLCGILIYYSELLPFIGLAFTLHAAVAICRGRWKLRPAALTVGGAFALAAVLLQDYFLAAIGFVLKQATHGAGSDPALRSLFPYYMHPS